MPAPSRAIEQSVDRTRRTGHRRPISPALHGLIDYAFAASNLLLPSAFGFSRRSRLMFGVFGVVQGTLNAVTVQPFGVERVVPFAVHGALEKDSAAVYFGVPLLAGINREPRARALWLVIGAALVAVYNLTDWDATAT